MPHASIVEIPSTSQHEGRVAATELGIRLPFTMPPENAARFPHSARLLRHADFERVYKKGRRHFSATMTVFYWARPEESSPARANSLAPHGLRVGFTVSRALGGAVQRNRMKRRLREAVRLSLPATGVAADVVINPKKLLLAADFLSVRNEVSRAFEVIEKKLSQGPSAAVDKKASSANREPEIRS